MRKMIIDTDTASDDAVAIVMALQTPDIEVIGITVVAGNMPVKQASINARYSAQMCGKTPPVYDGIDTPFIRDPHRAYFFHGSDGMGEMKYPDPAQQPEAEHAVPALIRLIRANPGVELVTLGPLTNVAAALLQAPDIVPLVSRCVMMGGAACTVGNITPAAEFNIWCDPEAARIVFRSGLPVEMVGWELCRGEANLSDADMRYMKEQINTPLAHFSIDCNASAIRANRTWLGDPALPLPDPVAMAIAIDPTICTQSSLHYVDVECEGIFTRGMTVVDQLDVTHNPDDLAGSMWAVHRAKGKPWVRVCWAIDIPRWKALLYKTVSSQ